MTRSSTADRSVETLLAGGDYFEGPRWRDGRWYVSDMVAGVVLAVDETGTTTTLADQVPHPSGLGWLPDGSLLFNAVGARRVMRRAPDGAISVHADVADICPYGPNDMVVDPQGRAWFGTTGFDLFGGEDPRPGELFALEPDGSARVAADGFWCANGIVLVEGGRTLVVAETFGSRLTAFTVADDGTLADRRVFAQLGETPAPGTPAEMLSAAGIAPDGLAVDAEDHVWAADGAGARCLRFAPDGTLVDELAVPAGLNVYACAIGGSDGRTLLMCVHPNALEIAQGRGLGDGALLTARV